MDDPGQGGLRGFQESSDRLLLDFLNTELDIGFTFCETARIERGLDEPARRKASENARTVIRTVEQFVVKVRDEQDRSRILTRLKELEGSAFRVS